ncbi:MAG TPA: S8 family serine peptidase [Lachnospiraceae bacterium]|nr:S8 family serine peptidase [Lachnospiraceae bacterium]
MTEEERRRITSEDYADLLVEYSGDLSILERFPNSTYRIINYQYAVVHIPTDEFTLEFISNWGYEILPQCYGVISLSSIEATGIQRVRSVPNLNLRGEGVLIGIIDTGIDYRNPIFQREDGTTRITSIWDQTIESENFPKEFEYGTEYTREMINTALQSENPLEIVPSVDEVGHGTMVAGIAAGKESPVNDFYGVATESELVVVKLKQAKSSLRDFYIIPEGANCFSEIDILFALGYILTVSNNLQRPIVICIALGTSQGGHDGRGFLSNTLSLIGIRAGTAVVVAAGNEGNARRHYFGTVDVVTGFDTVELNVGENEPGFVIEFWGKSPSVFTIDITSPSGEYIPRASVGLKESQEISFIFEPTTIFLLLQLVETRTGDQVIVLRFKNPSQGIWRFKVYERGGLNLGYHMWLPMNNFISNNTFFTKYNIYTTVLDLGNATVPITVTAYNDTDGSLYLDASRGYTRTEVVKPEIAAPGVDVIGPNLQNGFVAYTGTSVAAAHTAGVAAMMLEWGVLRNNIPNMSTTEMKKLFLRGAKRDESLKYPNPEWGYGKLDIFNVFNTIRLVL